MPKQYCHMIAKAVISNADNIISAIDRYIAKADEDLADTLKEEGFANEDETVEQINTLQEKIADILREQTKIAIAVLAASPNWKAAKKNISDMMDADDIADQVDEAVSDMLETQIPELATTYIKELEPDLVVDTLRWRTADWMAEWSERLGELMKINTHKQLTDLIQSAIDNGESISSLTQTIMDGGWRSEYYQARRVAVTEVLRAHSVAREEAIQQSPATDRKEWVHTGAHKNEPRQNHVDMSGQIVDKDKPFTLIGRDGATYYPMYPRDPILPPGESINCHCIHRGITNDGILGMSYEERKKMQQDIIDNDDGEWEKELNAQNKAKSGITEYNAMDNFKEKSRKEQIKYIGGKAKMALYDAGLIDSEEMLKKVKKSTLKELREDGILTVGSTAVKHSTVGDFSNLANPKKPAGGRNGGNMKGGGHSQANLDELSQRGIAYNIEKTYDNGVRIGGVENHTSSEKRLGTSGQSWFPESWDSDKITVAGTYTANKPAIIEELHDDSENLIGYRKFQKYDDVTVGIFEDADHNIDTIFPDAEQREVGD